MRYPQQAATVARAREIAGSLIALQRLTGASRRTLEYAQAGAHRCQPPLRIALELIADESIEPEELEKCAATGGRCSPAKRAAQPLA